MPQHPQLQPLAADHSDDDDHEAPPFSPSPARENRHTASRPPSMLFGAQSAKSSTSAVASTGLSLAGLPSSPSPYLLRSPDGPDYFSTRRSIDASGGDSPLFLRRAQGYQSFQGSVSAETTTGDDRELEQVERSLSSFGALQQRRASNGSVSTTSSSSSLPLGAASIMAALNSGDPDESGTTADSSILESTVTDFDSPPRSVSFAPDEVGDALTPQAQLLRSSQRSTGSVRSTFSDRSARSSSVDVDVGTPFPSESKKRSGPPKRLTQPTVIRSTSGRGIMFVPRTTEAAPVSSAGRPASFSGHSQNAYGLDIARNRTSLPMSPSAMKSRASSTLAGVLAASPRTPTIPDRFEPPSPDKQQTSHTRRDSTKSIGASSTKSTNTSTSDSSSTTVQSGSGSGSAPRRTNSQSSLRTRFISSRAAAPEAVVTTTSVSTSLAGGRHSLQYSGDYRYPMSHPRPESISEQQGQDNATSAGPSASSHSHVKPPHGSGGGGDHQGGRPTDKAQVGEDNSTVHVPTTLTLAEAGSTRSAGSGVGITTTAGPPVGRTTAAATRLDATEIHAVRPGISSSAQKSLSQQSKPQPLYYVPLRESETADTLQPAQQIRVTHADSVVPVISSSSSSVSTTATTSPDLVHPFTTPPPPPTRTVSLLSTPRKDDMNHSMLGSCYIAPVDDFSPQTVSRARGKKPASWHAKSDSEGETELHEVDDSPPPATAATNSASGSSALASSSRLSNSQNSQHSNHSSYSNHSNHSQNSVASSSREGSPPLGAVDYSPPYIVRKPKSTQSEKKNNVNHTKPRSTKSKDKHKKHKSRPAAKREPFTLTLAASMASSLPLPFDRRRIELIVSWSSPEGLWSYIPFAKFIPAWGLHVAGPRARMNEVSVQKAFELRGLLREFVACIPIVGRFAAWL